MPKPQHLDDELYVNMKANSEFNRFCCFYSILFISILLCSALLCSVLFCSVLFCSALFFLVLHCFAGFISVAFTSSKKLCNKDDVCYTLHLQVDMEILSDALNRPNARASFCQHQQCSKSLYRIQFICLFRSYPCHINQ